MPEGFETYQLCIEVKSGVKHIPLHKHRETKLLGLKNIEDYILLRHLLVKFDDRITQEQYNSKINTILSDPKNLHQESEIDQNIDKSTQICLEDFFSTYNKEKKQINNNNLALSLLTVESKDIVSNKLSKDN